MNYNPENLSKLLLTLAISSALLSFPLQTAGVFFRFCIQLADLAILIAVVSFAGAMMLNKAFSNQCPRRSPDQRTRGDRR